MRAQGAIVSLILAIALYFALFWGFDAIRILTSPMYGLDDVWRSQVVFGLGRYTGLGPEGIIRLAAVFGALKLVIAGACLVHIIDRARAMIAGRADPGILEAAMMLVVVVAIASVAPALWTQNADLIREYLVQLLLAGLAAALLIIERSKAEKLAAAEVADEIDADVVDLANVPNRAWYAPWR
ncbi:MAG: hypothetical protein JO237_07590 [Pseudolabrys sp.]|nr:hypothetical protein [Pseudolabrys sp.]